MASGAKKKTTMAKLTRESRLRERRLDKQAKKDARKRSAAEHPGLPGDALNATVSQPRQVPSSLPSKLSFRSSRRPDPMTAAHL
jgi:hypothetical protein